jgi:hypothetical protein
MRAGEVARPAALAAVPAALHRGQAGSSGGRSGATSRRWPPQVRDTTGLNGSEWRHDDEGGRRRRRAAAGGDLCGKQRG